MLLLIRPHIDSGALGSCNAKEVRGRDSNGIGVLKRKTGIPARIGAGCGEPVPVIGAYLAIGSERTGAGNEERRDGRVVSETVGTGPFPKIGFVGIIASVIDVYIRQRNDIIIYITPNYTIQYVTNTPMHVNPCWVVYNSTIPH